MDICETCILYGRCSGICGDVDSSYDMWERENDERDTYDYYEEQEEYDYD